jgi:glycosyltransferase involved in cell wall biosynthesis
MGNTLMSSPLVSVIIPVFNAAPYVRSAVNSIRRQSYQRLDIILIDDGSTDGTSEELDRLRLQDSRIRVISKGHLGLVRALNAGLDAARGELIARMDADDISYPNRIERQVALHQTNPALSLSGTHVDYLVSPTRLLRKTAPRWLSNDLKVYCLFDVLFVHGTVMMKRATIEDNRLRYDVEFSGAEDFEFFRHVTRHSEIAFLPEPLYAFRVNHVSIQSKFPLIGSYYYHKVIADNLNHLGLTVDIEAIDDILRPDRTFIAADSRVITDYLRAGKGAVALCSNNIVAAQAGFLTFASVLFETLVQRGDISLAASVFSNEQLIDQLRSRSRVLIALAKVFPRMTALDLRARVIRAQQIVQSRHFSSHQLREIGDLFTIAKTPTI